MSPVSSGRGRRGRGRARWRPSNPLRREMVALLDGGHDPTAVDPARAADAFDPYPPLQDGVARISKPVGENDKAMLILYRELRDAMRNSPYYLLSEEPAATPPLRYCDKKMHDKRNGCSLWEGEVPWIYRSLCPDDLVPQKGGVKPHAKRRRVPKKLAEECTTAKSDDLPKRTGERMTANRLLTSRDKDAANRSRSLDEMVNKEDNETQKEGEPRKEDEAEENPENENEDDGGAYPEESEGDFDPSNMFQDDDGYLSDDSGRDLPVL